MAIALTTSPLTTQPMGFATFSRTLVALAADVFTEVQKAVVGPENVRTARDNAWAAIQADRARAEARAETARAVAAMLAASPAVRPAHTRTKSLVTATR